MQSTLLRNEGGVTYRDLNKNGRLDPYEDTRRPIDERVEDLLSQMTLDDKAGMMFHTIARMDIGGHTTGPNFRMNMPPVSELIGSRLMNHFNVHGSAEPHEMAEWSNGLQSLAEQTRLGIPITLSTDPRHAFSNNPGTSIRTGKFSRWPEPIGLGATRDIDLVEQFGDIARQEYLAVGFRVALHPMADLGTEPRWSRIAGTFGEDAELAAQMVAAYIRGFQGQSLGTQSVACMTKHFPGGGPQKDGEDPHFSWGREQIYPGNNFDYHLIPFEAAFAAGTAQIMPYYGMPVGLPIETVGFGFNKGVITGLLREKYHFDGVVCTDWGLLTPLIVEGKVIMEARAWGVEDLSIPERAKKALEAGVDQFGGEACPEVIVDLVKSGQIPEARLDVSIRRLLRDKFRLGLFDNPFVDPQEAERIVGNAQFREAGELAQRRSIVLLRNTEAAGRKTLPLLGRPKIYVENIDMTIAQEYAQVVDRVEDADVAILRLSTPYQPRSGGGFASFFHEGDLDFKDEEKARILSILEKVPAIVDIFLERPAVIPEIAAESAALLANFGASDTALLDVIFGRFSPSGKLPYELPSSMEAVRKQKEDLPHDSKEPLFPYGFGLTY